MSKFACEHNAHGFVYIIGANLQALYSLSARTSYCNHKKAKMKSRSRDIRA